jgi:16S rRNA (cytosine1402-N4)-methyltransferase
MKTTPQQLHIPVLLRQVVDLVQPQKGEKYLDLTAGYGGHAAKIIELTGRADLATLVDRDENAQQVLREKFPQSVLLHSDFLTAVRGLVEQGEKFDIILADLGVSSPQIDTAERGFSFNKDGPLDMRMDVRAGESAATLIEHASVARLTELIVRYGEERPRQAARIARALKEQQPTSTVQMADIIAKLSPGGYHKIHPATRTFQALRIAVNDELTQVAEMLQLTPQLLNKGGRLAVISFHSLEDRLVKQFFKEQQAAGYEAELTEITKKPVRGEVEDVNNRRARSAKLRVACKIK